MIIFHNNSYSVCMRIFTTALKNKTIRQILNKNTSPYFHSVSLVIWLFTLMKRTHFNQLSISRFSTYIRRSPGWINISKGFSFLMTVIVQDDHLKARAWAACGLNGWIISRHTKALLPMISCPGPYKVRGSEACEAPCEACEACEAHKK